MVTKAAAFSEAATLSTTPDSGTTDELLKVRDLIVRYGSKTVVDRITFRVCRGEVFGLLGPNGAGKTSTLSAVEGILTPFSGSVHVAGYDVFRNGRLARANLGVQLQAGSLQPGLTVVEIIKLYCGLQGVRGTKDKIGQVLADFELIPYSAQRIGQLSGGQQQNVSLALATLHNPPLILLDEPTTGLDPQSRRRLWEHVRTMRNNGCGIVMTTHSMEEAQLVCDRIAIINHGVIIAADTPQGLIAKYREDPRVRPFMLNGQILLEDVFLGLISKEDPHAIRST